MKLKIAEQKLLLLQVEREEGEIIARAEEAETVLQQLLTKL